MAFFTLRGKRQTTFGGPLVAEWRAVSVRVKPHPDGARRAVSMATQLVPWTAQQNVRVCRVVYRRANTDMGQSVLVGGGGLGGGGTVKLLHMEVIVKYIKVTTAWGKLA